MSPANIAASVKARLQNKASESKKPTNDLLRLYGMERFLYRLSKSEHSEKFVLKGALLFMVWEPDYERRTTMDIDLLGFTENSLENLVAIAKQVCEAEVEEDGIEFDSESIRVGRIKEDADYEGVRILINAFLERSRIPIQIDIGFGDALVPGAIPGTVPTLLDFPAPKLRCYHQLTAIAEKFQATIKLGELNSRMKDFYDIWNIIQHEEIDGAELQKACGATFEQRETLFDLEVRFFSENFSEALGKETQWTAFVRKQGLEDVAPAGFEEVVGILQTFFRPMVESQLSGKVFSARWKTSGQWR
ncbi:MAG: nucleotidyl transferase AbiEii/AbiGii toxin family protein [Kiritimatiellales bacterium]|nr:nucleotidyl transferase AbiEii/AbiGii toxin family protein [Kiritimatiellota bacterium]MBL7015950.1 nucleotidyl transferase AbiEii/AbiGii toxin family protein [Kiritimatiellales bacterium]